MFYVAFYLMSGIYGIVDYDAESGAEQTERNGDVWENEPPKYFPTRLEATRFVRQMLLNGGRDEYGYKWDDFIIDED